MASPLSLYKVKELLWTILNIRELSKSPTNEDINAMMQNIKKAQTSVKKLRNSLASARVANSASFKGITSPP